MSNSYVVAGESCPLDTPAKLSKGAKATSVYVLMEDMPDDGPSQLLATHDKTGAENAFAMKSQGCSRRVTLWKHTEEAPPQLVAESKKPSRAKSASPKLVKPQEKRAREPKPQDDAVIGYRTAPPRKDGGTT